MMKHIGAFVVSLQILFLCLSVKETFCQGIGNRRGCPDAGYVFRRNRCYRFVSELKEFSEHQEGCESEGASLVSISDAQENAFVAVLAQNQRTWIGAQRNVDGYTFNWIDGTAWTYQNWRIGRYQVEPNFYNQREFCAEINFVRAGLWNDHFCDREKPAVCEKEASRLRDRVPPPPPSPPPNPPPGRGNANRRPNRNNRRG